MVILVPRRNQVTKACRTTPPKKKKKKDAKEARSAQEPVAEDEYEPSSAAGPDAKSAAAKTATATGDAAAAAAAAPAASSSAVGPVALDAKEAKKSRTWDNQKAKLMNALDLDKEEDELEPVEKQRSEAQSKKAPAQSKKTKQESPTPKKAEENQEEWLVCFDPGSKRHFFYHTVDGSSVWDSPASLLRWASANAGDGGLCRITHLVHPAMLPTTWDAYISLDSINSGESDFIFYNNSETGDSVWEPPSPS